ncbi:MULTISPECIES: terpene synthase family protein [unclassified Crossiella]|uniref:terpene synthase family protein n=1 Tax=unclassified Crossiella TaxID=2620835 RepID=UPI00200027C1|nr:MULTISPECIES: terpene synthase family protein [unclassified Crossiella]MCK2239897.1 terpene synthase family protein [Crossiella sp. S99.2]MCK2252605.1 terpene synthase family protein [Crossiella sp. S99.1]
MTQPVEQGLELLPFYCPIEPALHPAVADIETRAVAWLDRMALPGVSHKRLLGTRSAEFFCRFVPQGVTHNVLAATLWVYWGFAFDDTRCDTGALAGSPVRFLPEATRVQHALETPGGTGLDDPYALALHDIGARFRGCATPTQVRRFTEAHRRWLFGVAWQVANRASGHLPGLDEYLRLRLGTCGGAPTLAMLEIGLGTEVPSAEMDSPRVRALTDCASLVAALDNDLHSYRKERLLGHTEQNVVTVLLHESPRSLEQAVHAAVCLRDRLMSLFLRLAHRVRRGGSAPLRSYVDCLGHGIRGNIDWALRVPRYQGLGTPGWSEQPLDARPDPLPYSTVSWWWDELRE